MARDRLGQKVRALEVCAQQLLEAVLGRVEQIRAHTRSASGIVDERVDPAQRLARLAGEANAIRPVGPPGGPTRRTRPLLVSVPPLLCVQPFPPCSPFPPGPKKVRYGPPSARRFTYTAASRRW